MRKRTTTQKLQQVITKNLLMIEKVEIYYKTTHQTDVISVGKFKDNLDFLCESGVFADCIGWTFEKDYKTGNYIAECSRTDGNSENVVTAYLRVADGVNAEDIEETLKIEETEE